VGDSKRKVNKPDKVIIHCSATPNGRDFDVEDIRRWHLDRGWRDVGYHYIIKRDGTIQMGRVETEIGAHVRGHNTNSLGVCLIGDDNFTFDQYISLDSLYLDIYLRHGIGPDYVFGHYEFTDQKTCPNIDMDHLRTRLRKQIA